MRTIIFSKTGTLIDDRKHCTNIGKGIALGTTTALVNRNESSVRAGRTPFAIAVFQSAQVSLATSHLIYALEVARVAEVSANYITIALRRMAALLDEQTG